MKWLNWLNWLWRSCLLTVVLSAQAVGAPAQPTVVKLGFYLPTVRETAMADIKISLQVWAEEIAASLGFGVLTTTYQNMADMRAAVHRGELHFVNAAGMELAETFASGELQRGYARHQQGADEGLALLVRSDSALVTFADLRDKRVSRLSNDRLAQIFLETQCLKVARQHCSQFLVLTEESRDIQSVYSVFFGKADAALVTLATLKTAIELNPQVATRLKVILDWKAKALVFGMMTRYAEPSVMTMMMGSVHETLKTPRGRQMLELFKTDFVDPVESSDLNVYWRLLEEHRALEKAFGAKKK